MLFLLEVLLLTSYAFWLSKHHSRDVVMRYIPIFVFTILLSLAAVSSLEPPGGFLFLGGVIASGIVAILVWIPKPSSSHQASPTAHHVARR